MKRSATSYLNHLEEVFAKHKDPEKAIQMAAYLKNQFSFLGLPKPIRSRLSKEVIQALGVPEEPVLAELCRLCFEHPYREVQYFVNELVRPRIKTLNRDFIRVIDELIPQKAWWDTVDFLAPRLAGGLFLRFPETFETYTEKWIESPDIWYQRAAILSQLHFKARTDSIHLFRMILRRADSREFFVQKAAGWALREYSKTNPEAVRAFIFSNELPRLTIREGMKWMERKQPK